MPIAFFDEAQIPKAIYAKWVLRLTNLKAPAVRAFRRGFQIKTGVRHKVRQIDRIASIGGEGVTDPPSAAPIAVAWEAVADDVEVSFPVEVAIGEPASLK